MKKLLTAAMLFALSCQTMAVAKKMTITLYFADQEAMQFVTEKRSILLAPDEQVERVILRELALGPKQKKHSRIMGYYCEPLSIVVKEQIAYLNFPQDFYLKNRSGTTGELFLVGGIVNSLLELQHIAGVQFLVAGEIEEAAFGHWDTERPFKKRLKY